MIRKAKIEDLNKIIFSAQSIIKEMNLLGNTQWDEFYPTKVDFESDIKKGTFYIKEIDNIVVAFICIDQNEPLEYKNISWSKNIPSLILHRVGVIPKKRKEGLGTQLLVFAEKFALDNEIYFIKTDTSSINQNMILLFDKFNYNNVGSTSLKEKEDLFFCFEKNLNSHNFKK